MGKTTQAEHEHFLQETLQMAYETVDSGRGGPFAAMVVKNGQILGRGVNRVIEKNDPTAHAEIEAIRDACSRLENFQLEDCILYTSCEPCPMCLGAIYWARPSLIVYAASREDAATVGFDDAFIYDEIDMKPDKRKIKSIRLLPEDRLKPFEKWSSFNGKKLY